jgi:hypothetical protein
MPQPVVQTILNVTDGLFGLRYLKVVKSPSGPHFIVDVMFKRGLRLTSDILPGQPASQIGVDLKDKLRTHRATEYDEILPAVEFVSECSERVLSDAFGIIAECQLREEAMREAWEMTLFRRYIKLIDPRRQFKFEKVVDELRALYPLGGVESGIGVDGPSRSVEADNAGHGHR